MLIKKADDYQSWYIEEDNFGILVDPWLDKKINPFSSFFLQRTREKSHVLTEKEINKVKTIVITAPFADHLHTPSLKSLSKEIDIVSNKFVGKLIRKYGILNNFQAISSVEKLGPFIFKHYKAGFPYKNTSFSFTLETDNKSCIFHEGHISNNSEIIKNKIKSDIAILSADSVKLFGLISLSMNEKRAIKTAELLGARNLMITGTNPQLITGLISNFLKITESKRNKYHDLDLEIYYEEGSKVVI